MQGFRLCRRMYSVSRRVVRLSTWWLGDTLVADAFLGYDLYLGGGDVIAFNDRLTVYKWRLGVLWLSKLYDG